MNDNGKAADTGELQVDVFIDPAQMEGLTVYFVEDEVQMRKAYRRKTMGAPYQTEFFKDGDSALDAIDNADGLALVVSDLQLGNCIDGVEVLNRTAVKHPHASRILISTTVDIDTARRQYGAAAHAYLNKNEMVAPAATELFRQIMDAAVMEYLRKIHEQQDPNP